MSRREGAWKSIGTVHSPFTSAKGTPIQPVKAKGVRGTVEVDSEVVPALKDLEGFERIWLLYWFDRTGTPTARVKPFLDTEEHGLLATRAPNRFNPIGMSSVKLLGIEDNVLEIEDVDILDGTPLLDIKPYVPDFDSFPDVRKGWVGMVDVESADGRADERFENR